MKDLFRVKIGLLVVSLSVFVFNIHVGFAGNVGRTEKQTTKNEISAVELQKKIMTFADYYASLIHAASRDYLQTQTSEENNKLLYPQLLFSRSNAFIIAADPIPSQALLDMVVMVSLGHSIIKDYWQKEVGPEISLIVEKLAIAKKNIWNISTLVLSEKQQSELEQMIRDWRRNYPGITAFSFVRFQSLADDLEKVDMSYKKEKKRVSFMSSIITPVTSEVQKSRILAERGIYLGTRLPFLAGNFMDLWVSELADNPDAKKIIFDIHAVTDVSQRLATSVEKLPGQISAERKAAVNQIAQKVAEERKQIIKDLSSEEKQIREVLAELNRTLQSGTTLVNETNLLVSQVNSMKGEEPDPGEPSKPMDILEYKATIQEASMAIDKMNLLMKNLQGLITGPNWETALEAFLRAIDQVGAESDERISYFFIFVFGLLASFLIGQLSILIVYRLVSNKYLQKKNA